MKKQSGFAPLLIVVLIALVLAIAGGGYVVYKGNQQQKIDSQNVQNILNSQAKTQTETTTTQPTVPLSNPAPTKTVTTNTSVSSNVSTTLNCDNNPSCLISAAAQCKSASGTFTYSNVPHPYPWIPFIFSGKTQFEIKKTVGASSCIVVLSYTERTITYSATGTADMIAAGKTSTDIAASLTAMNNAFNQHAPFTQTCSMSSTDLASLFTNIKKVGPVAYAAVNLNLPAVNAASPSGGHMECGAMQNSK